MQALVCNDDDDGDVEMDDEFTSSKSDLVFIMESLLNLILNSRTQIPIVENTHTSYVVDMLMNRFYTLAIENNEYFPNQKFSSRKLPVHTCSNTNDQCQIGLDISSITEECLNWHLNSDEDVYTQIGSVHIRPGLIETNIQIDVLLLPECCYQKIKCENNDSIFILKNNRSLLNKNNLTYEVLERWDIKMVTEKHQSVIESSKNLLNINTLIQAIRSYLHFSQLSSWINQSNPSFDTVQQQQHFPKNVAFSISYSSSNEIDTDFVESNYDKQNFSIENLQLLNNKLTLTNSLQSSKKYTNISSTSIHTNLYSLKRNTTIKKNTTGIPQLTCFLSHNHVHFIQSSLSQPIPIDFIKSDLLLEPKSPDATTSSSSIVITTPTTFPNMPIYFDSNNNAVMNDQILESTSPKVLISSFQLSVDTGDYEDVSTSPILGKSFSRRLQINSSPAPLRKGSSFNYDETLNDPKSISNALSNQEEETERKSRKSRALGSTRLGFSSLNLSKYRPNTLLGNFEECLLNGRLTPVGIVDGFYAEIGASGSFFPEHKVLPVDASFYQVSDDIAASPYLGIINLSPIGERGYRIPTKGTIQVTLFNPNRTVVKMFVVMYDLSDMPCNYRTFLRQRTVYVPCGNADDSKLKSYLRYLIHLRFSTSKTGKMYLHSNIKLIFARNKSEIDPRMGGRYEYKTFTEAPKNPKYSPKK